MQIDAIDVFRVALPYRQPQTTPWGPCETLETVLVRMTSGSVSGWGEASPGNAPLAGPEWAGSVFTCVRNWLAPLVRGESIESGQTLQERLARVQGNRYAKAALDTAWWDLHARLQGKPLHQVLEGRREAIEIGVSFDQMEEIEMLLAALGKAQEAGFGRAELKFRPGWDVQMVNFVRRDFPLMTLHIDCEGALRLGQQEMLFRLDDFHLAMIEQPLPADDLVGHAMIQETIRTPLCLDESITTLEQAEMALELHSAKFLNLKVGRVGGFTTALAIHDAAHQECVACWVGGGPQSAIGTRLSLALAAKDNCTYPADYFPAEELLQVDVAPPLAPQKKTPQSDASADPTLHIDLWTEPGLGIEPDMTVVEKLSRDRATV